MKKWLTERFLPMWAKQTVLEDNRMLKEQLCSLRSEHAELRAYIRGVEYALRTAGRIRSNRGGEK